MAKVSKNELGMGIRALLGNTQTTNQQPVRGMMMIPTDQIETNPFQPRKEFDAEEISALALSIKTHGIIQPLTVRKLAGSSYQLIAGERRLRASKIVGLEQVPAYVRTADDQEMLEMALVENIQRHDLNAMEVAISYQRLIDECGLTHEAMSDRVGKKRSTISNYLRLLKLPPAVQEALIQDKISMGHARSLAGLDSDLQQLDLLQQVIDQELSVRATEKLIKSRLNHSPGASADISRKATNPLIRDVEDHLANYLSAKVQVKQKKNGAGTLSIRFGSDDELNRILDLIEGN